jgi:hypothetical protein
VALRAVLRSEVLPGLFFLAHLPLAVGALPVLCTVQPGPRHLVATEVEVCWQVATVALATDQRLRETQVSRVGQFDGLCAPGDPDHGWSPCTRFSGL